MRINKNTIGVCLIGAATLILTACGGGSNSNTTNGNSAKYKDPNVLIWELADPDMLNPVTSQGAGSLVIEGMLFQTLLTLDYHTNQLVPQLADSLPVVGKTDDGGMTLTFEIRKNAKWDDGTSITARDVAFSLKVLKCPSVDDPQQKPYFSFIESVKLYPNDPLKITFICNKIYILAQSSAGGIWVIPPKIYDPKGLMKGFTVKQFSDEGGKLANDPKIIAFGKSFNSAKFQRDSDYVVGSGPYQLKTWATGQKVVLVKKKNWWGDKLQGLNMSFDKYPPKITFQTINDQTAAIVALKAQQLDIMSSIKPRDFVKKLMTSKIFSDNYNTYTPTGYVYTYIGLNTREPVLSGVKTRQALAHLVNVSKIIKIFSYGYATRTVGPISPNVKKFYNSSIQPYKYNIEKAKELLKEDGWADTDGDGVLDKVVNGQKIKFDVKFSVNSGNDTRKAIALMFEAECKKVGIKVTVIQQDWSIYLQKIKNHQFDIYYGGWVGSPLPSDPEQIYSTKSYNGGSNAVGFGNAESDALIDSIRTTLDVDKRAVLWKKLQVIMHNQVAYIFLDVPQNLLAIHKRFGKIQASTIFPGYWAPSLKLQSVQTPN